MNLFLGTVQFGMDYGIAGQRKPTIENSLGCLDYAVQNGVTAIDTATVYGTAKQVVGAFLKSRTVPREKLFASSKLAPGLLDSCAPADYEKVIEIALDEVLSTLNTDYLDACMFHSSKYAMCPEMLEARRVYKARKS
ncbi:MAG: aldo/keto reductase [Oscillospiraceae bacterium]